MTNPEFMSDPEADSKCLEEFMTLLSLRAEEYKQSHGDYGGYSKQFNDKESISVALKPVGSEYPIIEDWLTRQPLETAVAQCLCIYEEPNKRKSNDPLVVQSEIKEIWIFRNEQGLVARKRVYSYEQPNFAEMDKLDNQGYSDAMDRFEERRQEHRQRQPSIDAMEEAMGLNRVSKTEIDEIAVHLRDA